MTGRGVGIDTDASAAVGALHDADRRPGKGSILHDFPQAVIVVARIEVRVRVLVVFDVAAIPLSGYGIQRGKMDTVGAFLNDKAAQAGGVGRAPLQERIVSRADGREG